MVTVGSHLKVKILKNCDCERRAPKTNMADEIQPNEEERELETKINKEIEKLKYYLEQTDDLIEERDYKEIETVSKRSESILDEIYNLVLRMQEVARAIRQWKKTAKEIYAPWLTELDKLKDVLAKSKDEIAHMETSKKRDAMRQEEEQYREEIRQRERQLWEEKLQAEPKATERKLEMEKASKTTLAKLPKLTITPFKGTAGDWVRFENMFLTQVDSKPISDEEKFGYLLEMVTTKVREKISNLKPGSVGYKTAWERLKKEYGQTRLVVNSHVDEIVKLEMVKGSSYGKVEAPYGKLSASYDALKTLNEHAKLDGFVMCTLNKLPRVKPDLVRTDYDWEEWSMEQLINNIQSWLRRNRSSHDQPPRDSRERNMYVRRGGEKESKRNGHCLYCKSDHWSDKCKSYVTTDQRKKFFVENKLCFNCAAPGHRGGECRSRGCFHCGARHHTSLCTQDKRGSKDTNGGNDPVLTGYTPITEEPTLPAIIPVKLNGDVFWAFLDTGSGRNFISREAAAKLNLRPARHELKEIHSQ